MFLVTGCIIEHEEGLGKAVCLVHKDVNCTIDLGDEFFHIEEPVMILSWLEHDVGLTEG
jgi:hypothetical protein